MLAEFLSYCVLEIGRGVSFIHVDFIPLFVTLLCSLRLWTLLYMQVLLRYYLLFMFH